MECRLVAEAPHTPPPKEPTVTEGIKVAIHPEYPEQTVTIDVPRSIAEHHLNIREGCQPIRQKRKGQAPDRNKAIQEEVAKLVEVEIMREMSFSLKNTGATYQRLVDKAFEKQIGQNFEVYVDDLLNPKKCMFDAEEGAFLGHMVSMQGIKACPEKAEAVMKLQSPQTLKEAQSLNGKLASFLIQIHRKVTLFLQNPQKVCKKERLLVDTGSRKGIPKHEEVHSGTTNGNCAETQRRTTNVSLCGQGSSKRSTVGEKKLAINTNLFCQPCLVSLENKLQLDGKTGLITSTCHKKAKELEAFDITYRPRTSIRGQILAGFIAEKPEEENPSIKAEEVTLEPWILFTDESSCSEGSGAGLILTSTKGEEFTYALRFEFDASNNEAEYEALIASLRIIEQMDYLEKAKALVNNFKTFSIEQVPRSENKKADALSKIAYTSFAHLTKQVLVEILKRKSIEEREILAVLKEEAYFWMTPLIEYLTEGTLPSEIKKARAIEIKERQYTMINGVLYRKSFLKPWLRCVRPTQAEYVVKEIHEGSYSMHSGPRSVVAKAIRSGYYWLTMHKDCMTRSSTKKLFSSFEEPEQEFRSSRRLFKTLSLDELRLHDFNLFSDQEEYSEEEVAKTIAETMEQYMSRTDYGSGVLRPKIKDKDSFELKGQFLKELRSNTFSGLDHEDANEHIEKVLEIIAADAKVAIQEIAEYSQKWYNGTSRTRSPYYTKDCPLKEEGKTLEEAYYTQFGNSNLIKEFRASTDAAIRNQEASIKTLEIQIWQMSKVISTTIKADASSIRRIGTSQYVISTGQNRASVSVMPLSTYLNLGLGKLAHTKLRVELADRSVKYPKGIAENVLVGIDKFTFPVDFIILDMPEDINVPLILGRPFLSIAYAKIDVFKRKFTLRVKEEKIIFKSVKPASSLIKKLGRDQVNDLMPTIEECEIVEEFRARNDARMVSEIVGYPSEYDHDKKICIDCAYNLKFSCMIDFAVLEDMDAYRDEGIGDVIFGESFLKEVGIRTKRFEGMITIYNGNDEVFSTWMTFGGNTRVLGSFREETNEITDLHQILDEVLPTKRGDGVASIKRCHRDLSSDGVWTLATTS
ncbi:reverse transcriptase domain-containing protein [Tanacetum coccineum]